MSDTGHATASVALDYNCMSTHPTVTILFVFSVSSRRGERGVVCLTLGMQLQASPSTATTCLPTRLQLTFFIMSDDDGRGGSCMFNTTLATASVVPNCNCMSTNPTATDLCFVSWR